MQLHSLAPTSFSPLFVLLGITISSVISTISLPALASSAALLLDSSSDAEAVATSANLPSLAQLPPRPDIPTLPDNLPSNQPGLFLEPRRPDIVPPIQEVPAPIPTVPLDQPPTPTEQPVAPVDPGLTVEVQEINVLDNTVFSQEELDEVLAPFIGKTATFQDLIAIRTAVTDLYTRNGYTTSGAFLPPQDVSSGVITVQVIEGQLERIEIEGLQRLRSQYVRDRINLAARVPLNISRLEEALQLLQADPSIASLQAELTTGTATGQSVLILNLRETDPFTASITADNYSSPSTGSFGGTVEASYLNILGYSDRLAASYERTEGSSTYDISYEIPVNPQQGTLRLSYNNSSSEIIEDPFAEFDINSDANTLSIGYRHPLIRTPTQEVGLGLTLDLRESQSFLFGDRPFSLSDGAEDGLARVTVLRFSQDWLSRSPQRIIAARSQISVGLNALDATINENAPDGRFVSWVGQFQYVQALGQDFLAIARLSAQLTGDELLALEQFSIGGVDTVRGYRTNQRVADNGIVGSLEFRVPVIRDPDGIGLIQLVPFFDIGRVWQTDGIVRSPATLLSTGLGLRWQLGNRFEARLDYGFALTDVDDDNTGDTLQDDGLVFSVRFQPF